MTQSQEIITAMRKTVARKREWLEWVYFSLVKNGLFEGVTCMK